MFKNTNVKDSMKTITGEETRWSCANVWERKNVPPFAFIEMSLRDGDAEHPVDSAYANAYSINANSATAPGIYGRSSITLYAFNSNGNRSVGCGFNNLHLIRVGESLGGKASVESDFATDVDKDFLN